MKRHIERITARLLTGLLLITTAGAYLWAQGLVPGLEVLLGEQKSLIEGKRVGLVTNHTGVDRQMRHSIDLLAQAPGVKLTAIFAPEHGIRGIVQAGGDVSDIVDERTGVPVYSIYGKMQRPTPAMLKNVDVLVYDIQDAGVRFYTYISTMGECMEAAAEQGIPFVLCDRPNPITAAVVGGRILDIAHFKSFVGAYPVPIRYGLTLGELAGFVREGLTKDVKLTVVRMKNYKRGLWYDQTGLPWIAPSPNLPTLASATIYPGMCLIEGTNISEGRGTMQPFEMIGAPWLNGHRLADELTALKLEGALFRPVSFTPVSSKYQGQLCQGIQLHVTDRQRFQPILAALHILSLVRRDYPGQFQWRESGFDRLAGSDDVRKAIEQGTPAGQIVASWQAELKKFDEIRKKHFLYE